MRPSIQRLVDRPADLAIGLPAPALLWATDISSQSSTRRSTTSSFASEHTDCSRLSIQAEKGISSSESSSGADWVPMAPPIDVSRGASPFRTVTRTTQQVDQRGWHPSIEDTDPRRQFIEKALDVGQPLMFQSFTDERRFCVASLPVRTTAYLTGLSHHSR